VSEYRRGAISGGKAVGSRSTSGYGCHGEALRGAHSQNAPAAEANFHTAQGPADSVRRAEGPWVGHASCKHGAGNRVSKAGVQSG
jgi:hypothetical protein